MTTEIIMAAANVIAEARRIELAELADRSKTRWTTWGPVRGGCSHAHQSPEAAQACLDRDRQGCRYQGGHSDRGLRILATASSAVAYDTEYGPGRPVAEIDRWED